MQFTVQGLGSSFKQGVCLEQLAHKIEVGWRGRMGPPSLVIFFWPGGGKFGLQSIRGLREPG